MIDPQTAELRVEHAANGWTVREVKYTQSFSMLYVARTPKELAELIQEWAQKQTDLLCKT